MSEKSILRAKQQWKQEKKAEDKINQLYLQLTNKTKDELATLYINYDKEKGIDYSELRRSLGNVDRANYESKIESELRRIEGLNNEEVNNELKKLLIYSEISLIDAKVNTLEAYTLSTIAEATEVVSESLSQTVEEIHSKTSYDIQVKKRKGSTVKKLGAVAVGGILMNDWTGLNYKEATVASRYRLIRDFKRELITGVKRKDSFSKLTKRLNELTMGGKGSKSILNILRGETGRVIADTSLKTYKEAGLGSYQFIATLDNRTTQICQDLDGTIHKVEDAEIGVNINPMHNGCRSTIAPYFSEDDLADSERRARDSTGKNYKIPGDISFKKWKKDYYK